ncbi:MAG: C39 family peptidase [Kiritimatiellia bacterium]
MVHTPIDNLSDLTGCHAWRESLPHPDRPACHTLRIPGYRQLQSYTCGFVVAANVLHYFKPEADLKALYEDLNSRHRTGTYPPQVMYSLRSRGIKVIRRTTLDWETLCEQLAEGKPVLSSIRTLIGLHWVVIYGYDSERKTVFICGRGTLPECNRKEIAFSKFVRRWEPSGNGLICWGKDSPMGDESLPTMHEAEGTGRKKKRMVRFSAETE